MQSGPEALEFTGMTAEGILYNMLHEVAGLTWAGIGRYMEK